MSDDMEPSPAYHMSESDDNAELESRKMNHNMLMALIKFLQKKRHSIIEKATAEGTEEVVLDAVDDNFASYNSNRFKKINKLLQENIHSYSASHGLQKLELAVKLLEQALCQKHSAKELEMESTTVPNWLELPREVTQNILKRVGVVEIVTSACLVCPLWWNICKDPLMWRTIDMGDHRTSHYDLAKILLYAIDRSCGQVEDIDIQDFCWNQVVESLYHFSSRLMKRIRPEFLGKGSSEVTKGLQLSEETEFLLIKDVIGIIGRSSPLLKSLKLGSTSDNDAFAISKTMSGLRHLKIFCGQITEAGLLAILEGCPHLETLHLQECSNLDLSESVEKRCRDKIKDFIFFKVESYQYDFSHLEADYEDFEDYNPYYGF